MKNLMLKSTCVLASAALFTLASSAKAETNTLEPFIPQTINAPVLIAGGSGCQNSANVAWRTAIELGAIVPGIGVFSKAILGINRLANMQVCGANGSPGLTLDVIMREVEKLIDKTVDKKLREDLTNIYGDILRQYKAQAGLIAKAEAGELSVPEHSLLINQVHNLSSEVSILEAKTLVLEWPAMPATALIGSLKNGLNAVLAALYEQAGSDLQLAADSFTNDVLPLERQDSIDAFLTKENQFKSLYGRIRMSFSKRREHVSAPLGGGTRFTINAKVTDHNSEVVYERNWKCGAHKATQFRCRKKHNSRAKQFRAEAVEAVKDARQSLLSTLDDRYFDYRNALRLHEGKRLVLMNKRNVSEYGCLGVVSNNNIHSVELKRCTFPRFVDEGDFISESVVEAAGDIWRFHDNKGMIIHEKSGLCLTNDGDKLITLSACNYSAQQNGGLEQTNNLHQQWSMNPQGFLIDIDANRCLNFTDTSSGEPSLQATLQKCEYSSESDVDSEFGTTNQMWSLRSLECSGTDECIVNDVYEPEIYERRRVLQADQAVSVEGEATTAITLLTDLEGYSDRGYVELNSTLEAVQWQDVALKAGHYKVAIRQASFAEELANGKALALIIDDEPPIVIELVNTEGEWSTTSAEFELPRNAQQVQLKSLNDSSYRIDRLSFTPLQ